MKPAAEPAQQAARQFVAALRPEDSLGVILFSDRAVFAHDLSKDRSHSYEAIDSYRPLGGTALYDSLYDSLLRLKHTETRRVVVVVTDGKDENNPGTAPGSTHTIDQVIALLRDVDAIVYTIGIGQKVERQVLERLALMSGGEAYFPSDVSSLAGDFRRVVENLRRRYIVTYTSTNPVRDGSWRAVEIKTSWPEVIVKSRGGYFAPTQ
jgi:Ca-activated chloride channel family protein